MTEPELRRVRSAPTLDRVRDHLVRTGWRQGNGDERTVPWRHPMTGLLVVVLPAREDFEDTPERLREAIRTIAYAERRSIRELLADIAVLGGADTLSIRLTPEGTPSGSAPLALAQAAVSALHDFVVGSASALEIPGLVLPTRRPPRAEAYAAQTLVSTEPGSFVVNLALPLLETPNAPPPAVSDVGDAQGALLEVQRQPYGRRVVQRMRAVAQRSVALADQVGAGDRPLRAFGEAGRDAANATELAALASLGGVDRGRYQIRFTEAFVGTQGEPTPARLVVTPAQQQVLAEAAEFLRTKQPRSGITVTGLVVRLARTGHFGPGEVTIQGESDDSRTQRRYQMEVSQEDYAEAMRAHREGLQVTVTGDLEVAGTRSSLRRLTGFAVLPGLE